MVNVGKYTVCRPMDPMGPIGSDLRIQPGDVNPDDIQVDQIRWDVDYSKMGWNNSTYNIMGILATPPKATPPEIRPY